MSLHADSQENAIAIGLDPVGSCRCIELASCQAMPILGRLSDTILVVF